LFSQTLVKKYLFRNIDLQFLSRVLKKFSEQDTFCSTTSFTQSWTMNDNLPSTDSFNWSSCVVLAGAFSLIYLASSSDSFNSSSVGSAEQIGAHVPYCLVAISDSNNQKKNKKQKKRRGIEAAELVKRT
tara:strand:+ start:511 stop:897 length:387 start_codon:yes stop_codon:yes gene_type:complete